MRRARERAGLSLEALADKIGMSGGTLGAWERGTIKTAPLATLLRFMAVANVDSIEILLGRFPTGTLASEHFAVTDPADA
ncbi:MAG: Helix-turn-helix domain [Actinomycetota bacterium]|jgi:transcriptional regulator with XRE-family HTH domain